MRFALLVLALGGCGGCDKDPAAQGDAGDAGEDAIAVAPAPRPPEIERLWEAAKDGDESDLARLANAEGPAGLEERAGSPALRPTALAAMGYTRTLAGLPLLGDSAMRDPEPLALVAAQSAEMLAAEPRRARDPEDALEVREGCDRLRRARADGARPKSVRDSASRSLQMLSDLCAP